MTSFLAFFWHPTIFSIQQLNTQHEMATPPTQSPIHSSKPRNWYFTDPNQNYSLAFNSCKINSLTPWQILHLGWGALYKGMFPHQNETKIVLTIHCLSLHYHSENGIIWYNVLPLQHCTPIQYEIPLFQYCYSY